MNSVTGAQLQPSSARANTRACTRAPSQQADAFVVARVLRLRNRTRCSSCWVPWVFWVRGDKWRVSSSRPSRLRIYLSHRLSLLSFIVVKCNYNTFFRLRSVIRYVTVRKISCARFFYLGSCRVHFLLFPLHFSSVANHDTRKYVWFMRGEDETQSLSHKDSGGLIILSIIDTAR